MRSALRTIWSKDHIDGLAKQLGDYREQLTLRVLLLLNANYALQDEKLDLLHKSNQEIVEVVSISWGSLRSMIEDHHWQRDQWQQGERIDAETRHAETIAAILTTRDGNCRTITGPHYSADFPLQSSKLGSMHTATTYKHGVSTGSQHDQQLPDFETKEFKNITKRISDQILNALHFRSITDRRTTIPKAYHRTFQWIYRAPESDQKPWDSFTGWLQHGRGCYWINGKAGSGKSTLMKYIHGDPRTEEALSKWSCGSELLVGSFFFWYAGSSLQKSQAGLIRSLLFDILSRKPELIPVLFPNICRSILATQLPNQFELSFVELKKAFMTLVNSIPKALKVFFLVDGLDEYEGDLKDT